MVGNWVVGTTTFRVIEHFKNAGKLSILILSFPFLSLQLNGTLGLPIVFVVCKAAQDLRSSNCFGGVPKNDGY